jgi:predicted nucleic acid-binding protein
MYKKIFFDANIILDIFDSTRVRYMESSKIYRYLLDKEISLFTSCDIITTLYYIDVKKYKEKTLDKIIDINKTLKVIDFSNKEVAQTCFLMKENKKYKDLEDTMQYILAKKENCDLIISNDENFYADDIEIMSSEEFLKKVS